MGAKSLELQGYGTLMVQPINVKEKEWETVDSSGNPLQTKTVGTRAHTGYFTPDGAEVPSSRICKKIFVEDEEMILPKFSPTKEVAAENITEIEDAGLIYRAMDRKFYNVVTDNQKIKDLILKEGKSLTFPLCAGSGWKIWNGILTRWQDKLILVGCIGDIAKELEKYSEETVELEIESMPQQKNMKKLVAALAMA